MSNYGKMMKEAARMQQKLADAQANVLKLTAEGTSGGGAVKVVARGDSSIASIKIDPQVLSGGDASMLEDMVLSATNQALEKVRDLANIEMNKVTAGISIPGLI